MTMRNIERLYNTITRNLCQVDGTLDYRRTTQAIIRLCDVINNTETSEETWWIDNHSGIALDTLITGAYWHYTEWHAGQASLSYLALSALGSIYAPGYGCCEEDNEAYQYLEQVAQHE